MISSVMISGNILLIVYVAFVFSYAISVAGVGEQLTTWMVGMKLSRLEFFVALFVLYTILGCLVESLGMIVITVPLLYPVLLKYGIDPIWFGIILVLFIELGQISPPIGINLFVIQSIWDGKLSDIVLGHHPVPSADVRAAGHAGGLAGARPVAAAAHEYAAMRRRGHDHRHAAYPTGLQDTPTRHRALRQRMAVPGIVVAPGCLRLHHRAAGRGLGLRRAVHHRLGRLDERARCARHGRAELRRDPRPRAPHLRFGVPCRSSPMPTRATAVR